MHTILEDMLPFSASASLRCLPTKHQAYPKMGEPPTTTAPSPLWEHSPKVPVLWALTDQVAAGTSHLWSAQPSPWATLVAAFTQEARRRLPHERFYDLLSATSLKYFCKQPKVISLSPDVCVKGQHVAGT